MAMKEYEGKNVFVSLNTGSGKRVYSGKVIEVIFMGRDTYGVEIYMITITDKFDALVTFTSKEIEVLEEER